MHYGKRLELSQKLQVRYKGFISVLVFMDLWRWYESRVVRESWNGQGSFGVDLLNGNSCATMSEPYLFQVVDSGQ